MAALRWRAKLGVETPVSRQLCAFALPALLGRSAACHAQSAKPSSQVGPVQSNGICLLDLPAQFHWKPGALTKLVVVLPHVHTCPAPVSDPGGLRSWTRAPGGVVGPVRASAKACSLPGISARQTMFEELLQFTGIFRALEIPCPPGPRNWGQSTAETEPVESCSLLCAVKPFCTSKQRASMNIRRALSQ